MTAARPFAYVDPPQRPAFALPQPPEGKKLISLAINESAFGASPLAIAAVKERAGTLHRYPDPSSQNLRIALARSYELDPERIVCGNGSEELLDVIGRMFAREGDEIIMAQSGFFQFALIANRQSAKLVRASEQDLIVSNNALLNAVTSRTKLVFLAIPNNPTGLSLSLDQITSLYRTLPSTVVLVLDLAYGEYLPKQDLDDFMRLAERSTNIVVTRTFSKAFGLAALRVGWLYAPSWMVPGLNLIRGVGSVNALAQAAATQALQDLIFVDEVVRKTTEERDFLAAGLERLKMKFVRGMGNFLLTQVPAGFTEYAMAESGIWLRPVGEPGFAGWSRFGVGTRAENELLLETLVKFGRA